MAAAHLFLQRKSSLASLRSTQTSMLVFAAVVGAVAIHIFLYDVVASRSVTIGRIASPLYAPAVAVVMYLVARYDTFSSRFFSSPLLVRLGEASYSIYLLHEVLPSLYKRLGILAIDPSLFWPMWGCSLVLLAIISRGSYVYFERPARFAIRKWLAPKSNSIMKRVKLENSAEHYSSIPIAQLVPVLDAPETKPERNMRERTSNNDARQPFQFTHRLDPAVLPDRKIRGGLQQIHSKVVVTMPRNGENFDFRASFG